ncbi:acyl-CoA N-acyltransferase [Cristinia sonorae]|uniref:Acyl-CoA N-acyltransferase n=1 Tax=Cristinia sonorae TaxID=1940300 RepID=A0A8K0UKW4_9AGAR|nr:acyl-CoA N-acyltransferase [Cristinia sonorae]
MSVTIPPHEILIVDPTTGEGDWQTLRQQCYDVRIDVFHHEQGFPLETEIDNLEDSSTHILLRLVPSLKPVGTIRYTRFAKYSKLSRLAVLKEYRQFKFGRKLVEALNQHAIRDATKSLESGNNKTDATHVIRIVCHSQIPVKPFYAKFGYEPEGDEFDEDGAPHQRMVATLPLSQSQS